MKQQKSFVIKIKIKVFSRQKQKYNINSLPCQSNLVSLVKTFSIQNIFFLDKVIIFPLNRNNQSLYLVTDHLNTFHVPKAQIFPRQKQPKSLSNQRVPDSFSPRKKHIFSMNGNSQLFFLVSDNPKYFPDPKSHIFHRQKQPKFFSG